MDDPFSIRPAIITNGMKIAMTFIDRVGFPVLAFLLMWWLNIQLTRTIEKLNLTLTEIKQVMMIRQGLLKP
jgi:hypothetical protein